MKKGLLAAVIIVLCVAIGVGVTYAFFTQETQADNIVTMGNIKAEVSSLTVDEEGEDVVFDGNIVSTVPGKKTPWKLSVINKGNHSAYVRVFVERTLTARMIRLRLMTSFCALTSTTKSGFALMTATTIIIRHLSRARRPRRCSMKRSFPLKRATIIRNVPLMPRFMCRLLRQPITAILRRKPTVGPS